MASGVPTDYTLGMHTEAVRVFLARLPRDLASRLKSKASLDGDCWTWPGYVSPGGYARVTYRGRPGLRLHRLVYMLAVGPLGVDQELHHTCHTRACFRVDHLVPMSRAEHTLSHQNVAARAACSRGHAQVGENVILRKNGHRGGCRPCERLRDKARDKIRTRPRFALRILAPSPGGG